MSWDLGWGSTNSTNGFGSWLQWNQMSLCYGAEWYWSLALVAEKHLALIIFVPPTVLILNIEMYEIEDLMKLFLLGKIKW